MKMWTLFFLLLLAACGAEQSAEMPPPNTPTPVPTVEENAITILAVGDSLTDGFGVAPTDNYPAQLERRLQADGHNVVVTNAGISGETSSAALSRLDWLLGTDPDIVIIETGGNDGLRGTDLTITRENIDGLVEGFTANGSIVIVAGMQIVSNLGDDYTQTFAAIYPEVAARHAAILVPFFLEGVAGDPELNQADFIHPTAEGYTIIVDNLYPFVEQALEQLPD